MFTSLQYVQHPSDHRLIRERSLMSKCGSFPRYTTLCTEYPLQDPFKDQGLPQSVTPIPSSFNSCHKTVLRILYTHSRTYLTRVSRDMIFMFVVYVLDLTVKVWFVFIVLTLEVHGLFCWFFWTFLVVPLYLYLCIYHLHKRHMMSGHVWVLSAFVFIIVLAWHLLPSAFAFFIRMKTNFTWITGSLCVMYSKAWHPAVRKRQREYIYGRRCNERLEAKTEGSKRLAYTGFRGGRGHLKIVTKLRGERFESVRGECAI